MLFTGIVVFVAIILVCYKYWNYIHYPWTRDGQICAQVVQIAPRVSGPIVNLPIDDNQFVKAGDLLFEIDPSVFKAELNRARAELRNTINKIQALGKDVEAAEASLAMYKAQIKQSQMNVEKALAEKEESRKEFERNKKLLRVNAISQKLFDRANTQFKVSSAQHEDTKAQLLAMKASLKQAEAALAKAKADLGEPGEKNGHLRQARANLALAELNLKFTKVFAPVDGYVTNLNIRKGTQAVTNQPMLALVDSNSFWVYGFFRENCIEGISSGNAAVVTLMSYPDSPIEGRVESVGWGIAQDDGSTGHNLLPSISPTFQWIRLAERIPVRIKLNKIPPEVKLRVGTTASVLVKTGTGLDNTAPTNTKPVASPKLLQ